MQNLSVIESDDGSIWKLATEALHPDRRSVIDWRQHIPAGVGSKHQREYLIASGKGLLKALLANPHRGSIGFWSTSTLLGIYGKIQTLTRWMVSVGIWRFSKLQGESLLEFLEARAGRGPGGRITNSTLARWLWLFRRMWELRTDYVAALSFDPMLIELEAQIRCRPRLNGRWKPLDESVALPLVHDALNWVANHGDYISRCMDILWRYRESLVGVSHCKRKKRSSALVASFDDDDAMRAVRAALQMPSASPYKVLQEAVTITEGACVTALLFLLGIRVAELMRLDDDCLLTAAGVDGGTEHWIAGVAAKKRGQGRTWAASSDVAEVIRLAHRLYEGARSRSGQTALFVHRPGALPVAPGGGSKVRRCPTSFAVKRLIRFANAPFRPQWPAEQKLHPHVARKTFARMVVLRDKSVLESLAHHFGHSHRAITDGYYVGGDIELASLLDHENRRDLAQNLLELLSAPHVGGKAGAALKRAASNANSRQGFRGRKSLTTLVERLIDEGVQLAPCDWGFCVYAKSLSACGGDELGPNEADRAPDVCAGCANFAVTERHKSWWEQRLKRECDFLSRGDLPEQTVQFVRKRIQSTERVLKALVQESAPRRSGARSKL